MLSIQEFTEQKSTECFSNKGSPLRLVVPEQAPLTNRRVGGRPQPSRRRRQRKPQARHPPGDMSRQNPLGHNRSPTFPPRSLFNSSTSWHPYPSPTQLKGNGAITCSSHDSTTTAGSAACTRPFRSTLERTRKRSIMTETQRKGRTDGRKEAGRRSEKKKEKKKTRRKRNRPKHRGDGKPTKDSHNRIHTVRDYASPARPPHLALFFHVPNHGRALFMSHPERRRSQRVRAPAPHQQDENVHAQPTRLTQMHDYTDTNTHTDFKHRRRDPSYHLQSHLDCRLALFQTEAKVANHSGR